MFLLYFSCLERSDEAAVTISAAKTTQPMTKSEYDRLSDNLVVWNKDICRRETGTIAGKGNPHYAATATADIFIIHIYYILHASYLQLFAFRCICHERLT